jgi:hypothetical protein
MAMRQQNAVVGKGEGVSSFVHIRDAAIATVALLAAQPGATAIAGEDAVYYATKLSGASNAKAKRILGWRPRRLEWLEA